jgi:hypothetical protein
LAGGAELLTRKAVAFIEQHKDRPFFLGLLDGLDCTPDSIIVLVSDRTYHHGGHPGGQ